MIENCLDDSLQIKFIISGKETYFYINAYAGRVMLYKVKPTVDDFLF